MTDIRKQIVKETKRVVIKIGSSVLSEKGKLRKPFFRGIAREISQLKKKGYEVVVVSSGAIASGMDYLQLKTKPHQIPKKQAVASIGQPLLMHHYFKAFEKLKINVSQILITREDLKFRHRYLNAKHAFAELFKAKVVPIVNENDSVAVEEIQVGDNDQLSALVAHLVDADLLIILTDIDGFYDKDPKKYKGAQRIPLVDNVDDEKFQFAEDTLGEHQTGGMTTKLKAAHQAAFYGVPTWVVGGHQPKIISSVFSAKDVGTLFLPQNETLSSRKYWIAYTLKACGKIFIDSGAVKALRDKKKSLLPSGIKKVTGNFDNGDAVDVVNENEVPVARGLSGYSSRELEKIKGLKSSEIEKVLGYKFYDEVINRDDLVIL